MINSEVIKKKASSNILNQFSVYLVIGGISAVINLLTFVLLNYVGVKNIISIPSSFIFAGAINYILCIKILFIRKSKWNSFIEILLFYTLICFTLMVDYFVTVTLIDHSFKPWISKSIATIFGVFLNFIGRRYLVFK